MDAVTCDSTLYPSLVTMSESFLDSIQGEIAFFRAIMHSRPIGIHRNFHLISMRSSIHKDTGEWVDVPDIVKKLRDLYDVDALNAIVSQQNNLRGRAREVEANRMRFNPGC